MSDEYDSSSDSSGSKEYCGSENQSGDEESVWEEEDEHDDGSETEQIEYRYEEWHFQRGDEDDVWGDEADEQEGEPDYHWHEEGGGWGEDMEGYDEDNHQAASEPDPPNMRCTICLETVCRPVVTLCLHVFCDECIYNVLRHGSLTCPLCRATITEPPEPDTILDLYLEQAIADGIVTRRSGGRSSPYTWRDINFSQP